MSFDHIAVTEGGWVVDLEMEMRRAYNAKGKVLADSGMSYVCAQCMWPIALDIQI